MSTLTILQPGAGWPRKYAAQWINKLACYHMVRRHEQRTKREYEVYFRIRLDTMLYQPMPLAFFAPQPSDRVIIPAGEDFGRVNDLGDEPAFTILISYVHHPCCT